MDLGGTIWKKGRKTNNSEKFSRSGTGTINVMFFCFDQHFYFGHNLVISYPI